ncbi:MAG TPA: hypothetical protein VMV72_09170 [Verrucomicrobiae bacterium]|nr:hypothetical protein [Verrucomicrobiae bacterium]
MNMVEHLEEQLDGFRPEERQQALRALAREAQHGRIALPPPGTDVNLHTHTFFSYNAYGYSPSKFAWLARRRGLAVAGIVDFDVLDGVEEFLEAGRLIGLKTVASIESRVYVPEFSDRVINSPGEPGIAYHMGAGFTRQDSHPILQRMRATVAERNRDLLERVNRYLKPVVLDYESDVLPLTPNGNATERHICAAYERRAIQSLPRTEDRQRYWTGKLGECPAEGAPLQTLIRAKTMKRGGAGYVQPDDGSFPWMEDMNRFVRDAGAIPTLTWLDGTSPGEQALDELFAVAIRTGAVALNIIPDRNYKPGLNDQKLQNLYDVVAMAEKHFFPIIVGTEMNAPGNKFVDSFDTAELQPLVPVFLKGAHILYAHSVLQRRSGFGYLSSWAKAGFTSAAQKNEFFEKVGQSLDPGREHRLGGIPQNATPQDILNKIK